MTDILLHCCIWYNRAYSRVAPSQWETSLHSNDVSHWLGANFESAVIYVYRRATRNIDLYKNWVLLYFGNVSLWHCTAVCIHLWQETAVHITGQHMSEGNLWTTGGFAHNTTGHWYGAVTLNMLLKKQSSCWWFETSWRLREVTVMNHFSIGYRAMRQWDLPQNMVYCSTLFTLCVVYDMIICWKEINGCAGQGNWICVYDCRWRVYWINLRVTPALAPKQFVSTS